MINLAERKLQPLRDGQAGSNPQTVTRLILDFILTTILIPVTAGLKIQDIPQNGRPCKQTLQMLQAE